MAADWKEIPFSEAVLLNPTTPLKKGSVYPFVDMQAITAGARGVTFSEHREFTGGGSRFQNQDTLMARITPCLENGKIARFVAPDGEPIGHGSTEFIVVRGRPGVSDNDYAYYLTISPEVRNFAISQMTGSSGRQRVPTDSLGNIDVLLPPLDEQRAIAAVLGVLDDKIELNRRMNETLEALAQSLFKSWFVDATQSALPKGWRESTIGELCEFAYGKALKAETRRPGSIPVYGSNGQVGWHDEVLVRGPGIIVGRKGNPGIVIWSPTDFFPIDTTFYVVPKGECRSLYFLFHALRAHDLASLGADSAVPGLNRNMAYMSKEVLPPTDVQEAFDNQVRPLFERVHHNNEESRTLAALRDALLPKLLSGELRVPASQPLRKT